MVLPIEVPRHIMNKQRTAARAPHQKREAVNPEVLPPPPATPLKPAQRQSCLRLGPKG